MYGERCRILYVPGIEECDNCGRRLRPLRPGRSPSVVLVWLLLYTVIPVVEVAAASTYLTRFLRVADAKTPTSQAKAEPAPPAAQVKAQPAPRADKDKPSPAPPEAGGPAPLYEVRPDMPHDPVSLVELMKIGRASCRERV